MSTNTFLNFLFAIILTPLTSHALVDMRNANFSDTWTDLQVKTSTFDLRVQRTYNSRTLFNGIFGFGWCSEYETQLAITPENSIRVTECGAGFETIYTRGGESSSEYEKNIKAIMAEIRKRNRGRPESYFSSLENDIRIDTRLRDDFISQFKIASGKVAENARYIANGRSSDYITLSGGIYTRNLPNGSQQKFNQNGRLTQINDRNGNFIKIKYKDNKIVSAIDNTGASLQFKYGSNSKFVSSVVGPGGLSASYTYSGENLVSVTNAWKNTYRHEYDNLYNITKVAYPDKTTIELTYDKDKDWVMSFKDRSGCKEVYKYTDNPKDPINNYGSSVVKTCGNKVTNKSEYEFWHKTKKDGTRYLARTRSVNNGKTVDTVYDESTGRPAEITQNGITSKFEYFPNGLMKKKVDPINIFAYKYENPCNKVSEVMQKVSYRLPEKPGQRKPSKVENRIFTTEFRYDTKKCNLMAAKNSQGQTVELEYDLRGRITRIYDQSKKEVKITYEERFGKPHIVTRPGLGTIKFKYKPDGSVEQFDSKDDPLVAVQVASIFSNLLEIIAPATTDTNNI